MTLQLILSVPPQQSSASFRSASMLVSGVTEVLVSDGMPVWDQVLHRTCQERLEDGKVGTMWQVNLHGDRQLMVKYGKIGRNLTMSCAIFMYTGGLGYHTVLQYAIGTTINEYNYTLKPLVYPSYSALYDVQMSPFYELAYIAHCICGYFIYSITSGSCGLAALFATHACGQIDIIMARLKDLVDDKFATDESTQDDWLKAIVQHHLQILQFSARMQTILQEVCLVEFIGSTFLICLLEYYCLTVRRQI